MKAKLKKILQAWEDRTGPAIFATVNPEGVPNIIYVTCVGVFGEDKLVVADNYFDKTRRNLQGGCTGALLFQTKEGKAYQVKGKLEYHTKGKVFTDMKKWNPPQHPGNAAVALSIEEGYTGAKKVC
jgi:predicted pyridoxine 5'-phosphate oxidase superfamily flavin-nucleotide-binding protein